jgi:nicotinamidase-related amidase
MSNWEIKGKPALILIHMQNAIASEDGAVAFFGHAKAGKEAGIIPRQQALLKAFRQKKFPVIYVSAVHDPNPTFPAYGKFWESLKSLKGTNLAGSKDTEVIPELAPQPGEPVLGNWPINVFSNSGLGKVLKDSGAETLVLAGLATDIAVFTAAVQSSELGYSVIVPSDASASAKARAHEVVMNDMLPGMALVTTTEDVLAHL